MEMEKAEKESLMSLLVRDQLETTFTASPSSSVVNLQYSAQQQSLLPLSLFAADTCCNLNLAAPKTSPPLPSHFHHQPPPQYGAVAFSQSQLSDYSSIFNHLPDLLSLDHSPYKRPHQILPSPPYSAASSPLVAPRGSRLARKRRQTLADKTRCLQKLLPWEKKMDTAAMLESAHRYVRFLQAQVAALQAMPIVASDSAASLPVLTRCGEVGDGGEVEVLSRLSRSQLLQVVVNSPVAQMRMADLGRCVFSVEQLALLNKRSVIRSAMASAAAGSSRHHYPGSSASSFIDSRSSASASGTN